MKTPPKKQTSSTRAKTTMWLVGQPLNKLQSTQLPTRREALQRMQAVRATCPRAGRSAAHVNSDIALTVSEEIVQVWNKAAIPTAPKWRVAKRLRKLGEEYGALKKSATRQSATEQRKRQIFVKTLDGLFDVSADSAEQLIRNDRLRSKEAKSCDVKFLRDQKTKRNLYLDSEDVAYRRSVMAKLIKENGSTKRRTTAKQTKEPQEEDRRPDTSMSLSESEPDGADDTTEDEFRPRQKHEETRRVSIPKRVMASSSVCAMADRLKLSHTAVAGITSAVLQSGGNQLEEFSVSASTARRGRAVNRTKIATEVKAEFKRTKPKHVTVHWDGKMLENSRTGRRDERLAVLVSGGPAFSDGKLLGVSVLEDGTGKSQMENTVQLLDDWCVRQDVVAMVFDTCAANTGRFRGACSRLERCLSKHVLWLACRHHVLELVVRAAWTAVFGSSTSPVLEETEQLKKVWTNLDLQQPYEHLQLEDDWLKDLSLKNVTLLGNMLESGSTGRHDYAEMAELVLVLLGAEHQLPSRLRWRKPGANHRARWMANCLYGMKMFAWQRQLGYGKEMSEKLRRFVQFLCVIYASAWMTAPLTADAPQNDLLLIQTLQQYERLDGAVARACLKTLSGHLWYLCEETVSLALFGSASADQKDALAKAIMQKASMAPAPIGKPKFPKVETINTTTSLPDLVGKSSGHIFSVIDRSAEWLQYPSNMWSQSGDYIAAATFVTYLKSVNDASERAVKLIEDFHECVTNDEETRQELLQVVEWHRREIPLLTKKAISGSTRRH